MRTLQNITRRDFIKGAAGLCFSAGTLTAGQREAVSVKAKPWVIACRDSLLKVTKKPDCWSAMKELGVTGVEVEVNPDLTCPVLYHPEKKYSLASASDIRILGDDLSKHGLVITAFLMHNRFDERLEEELEWTRKLVDAAQKLDTSVIRIDVVPRRTQGEEFLPFAIRVCKQLCDIVEGTPVRYGIENHGSITNDPEFLQKLFDGVGSPNLGLTLDTANFYWYGHPLEKLYKIFERFASRAFHTHCKSIRYPLDKKNTQRPMGWEYNKYSSPLYEGDIDFEKVVKILHKVNYQGDLCLENETLGKYPEGWHTEILKKEIALLRNLNR